jgi:hypothetical protein
MQYRLRTTIVIRSLKKEKYDLSHLFCVTSVTNATKMTQLRRKSYGIATRMCQEDKDRTEE